VRQKNHFLIFFFFKESTGGKHKLWHTKKERGRESAQKEKHTRYFILFLINTKQRKTAQEII